MLPTSRWQWLNWKLEQRLLHLFGIESSIPDPQLCSWQHILLNKHQKAERMSLFLYTHAHKATGIGCAYKPGRCWKTPHRPAGKLLDSGVGDLWQVVPASSNYSHLHYCSQNTPLAHPSGISAHPRGEIWWDQSRNLQISQKSHQHTFKGNNPSLSKTGTRFASKGPKRVLLTSSRWTKTPSPPSATGLISRLFGIEELKQEGSQVHFFFLNWTCASSKLGTPGHYDES